MGMRSCKLLAVAFAGCADDMYNAAVKGAITAVAPFLTVSEMAGTVLFLLLLLMLLVLLCKVCLKMWRNGCTSQVLW